ncbi:MAG: hypothetical protein SFU86_00710 [Pirellulaceae bacterium]|nr:hypothetical protein [Pirellulaceae bacterium]
MPESPSVLIVEPSADEREVLRTVLARRGLRIFEADQAAEGLELARQHRPAVIVLDQAAQATTTERWREELTTDDGTRPSLIILGKVRRESSADDGEVVARPYHFGPLVARIEALAARAA